MEQVRRGLASCTNKILNVSEARWPLIFQGSSKVKPILDRRDFCSSYNQRFFGGFFAFRPDGVGDFLVPLTLVPVTHLALPESRVFSLSIGTLNDDGLRWLVQLISHTNSCTSSAWERTLLEPSSLAFCKETKGKRRRCRWQNSSPFTTLPSLEELWMEMLDGENFLCVHFDVFLRVCERKSFYSSPITAVSCVRSSFAC